MTPSSRYRSKTMTDRKRLQEAAKFITKAYNHAQSVHRSESELELTFDDEPERRAQYLETLESQTGAAMTAIANAQQKLKEAERELKGKNRKALRELDKIKAKKRRAAPRSSSGLDFAEASLYADVPKPKKRTQLELYQAIEKLPNGYVFPVRGQDGSGREYEIRIEYKTGGSPSFRGKRMVIVDGTPGRWYAEGLLEKDWMGRRVQSIPHALSIDAGQNWTWTNVREVFDSLPASAPEEATKVEGPDPASASSLAKFHSELARMYLEQDEHAGTAPKGATAKLSDAQAVARAVAKPRNPRVASTSFLPQITDPRIMAPLRELDSRGSRAEGQATPWPTMEGYDAEALRRLLVHKLAETTGRGMNIEERSVYLTPIGLRLLALASSRADTSDWPESGRGKPAKLQPAFTPAGADRFDVDRLTPAEAGQLTKAHADLERHERAIQRAMDGEERALKRGESGQARKHVDAHAKATARAEKANRIITRLNAKARGQTPAAPPPGSRGRIRLKKDGTIERQAKPRGRWEPIASTHVRRKARGRGWEVMVAGAQAETGSTRKDAVSLWALSEGYALPKGW